MSRPGRRAGPGCPVRSPSRTSPWSGVRAPVRCRRRSTVPGPTGSHWVIGYGSGTPRRGSWPSASRSSRSSAATEATGSSDGPRPIVGKGSVLADSVGGVTRRVVRSIDWSNWAGTESSKLARVATPRSEAEVVEEVVRAADRGLQVKAIGAGHSFTGVAVTDGVQLRLGALSGVTSIDSTRGEATVRAGTPLHVLNEELAAFGCALPNLGDIDRQSLAGATGTGTHGTGLRLTGLSAGIRALRIVLADGSVVDCSPTQEPELFQAARLGLGALGVVTEITVGVGPAFLLHTADG